LFSPLLFAALSHEMAFCADELQACSSVVWLVQHMMNVETRASIGGLKLCSQQNLGAEPWWGQGKGPLKLKIIFYLWGQILTKIGTNNPLWNM